MQCNPIIYTAHSCENYFLASKVQCYEVIFSFHLENKFHATAREFLAHIGLKFILKHTPIIRKGLRVLSTNFQVFGRKLYKLA